MIFHPKSPGQCLKPPPHLQVRDHVSQIFPYWLEVSYFHMVATDIFPHQPPPTSYGGYGGYPPLLLIEACQNLGKSR